MPDITLLVGTKKGAFLIDGGADRSAWHVRGPFCDGAPVNHIIADPATGVIHAGGGDDWQGAQVWRSADRGTTWQGLRLSPGKIDTWAAGDANLAARIGWTPQPLPFAGRVAQVWSMAVAGGRVYAGTKPARLLASDDDGTTWHEVSGLTDHPSSDSWHGGAAGLVLHSILSDPADARRIWVGISAAGVFATEDGGATWDRRNRLSNADCGHHDHPAAPRDGDVGHCVHNMMRAADGRLYQQNHHGVWRSDDGGRSWADITAGLPSTFGFPIRVHPRDPDTLWTLPLNGDSQGRFPPDAACAVWRSRDGGQTWQALRRGLPQTACFFTVLRQAMAGDSRDPAGVYFGTNSGSVFGSTDEGETWAEVARHLPTVLSVEVMERG